MVTQKQLAKKIKELREDARFSQEQFAKKIGLSRAALSQLELGKRKINALELIKIAKVFNISVDFLLRNEAPASPQKNKQKQSARIKLNKSKLKNVILYILDKCGGKPNLGETVLYKLLYFIDFNYYEVSGKSITGMNYVKLQYGPVPMACEYNQVIKEMLKNNELKIITQYYHNKLQKRYIALVDFDANVFNKLEEKTIDKVLRLLSDMNAVRIENYVHGDLPWQATKDKRIIDYNLVFDRTLPYAQKDYDKLFRQASAQDVLKDLGPLSKEEYDYYNNL